MGKRFTIRRPLIPAMLGGVSACGVVVVVVFTPSREPLLALLVTVLVLSLLWLAHRLQGARYLHVREQFLGELCMVCGYDVRGGTSRCPECAARVWRASDPPEWPELLWPQMPANVIVSVGPHEFIEWMLAQRAGTAADVWHDVARQKAAFIVLNACGLMI